ncbi:uncharacterized protein LOC129791561 [Lutzomyia longipalpis]|uniref:uncharacterized protein LOC129791561 n=1 Tax=Lutzomyia longipalpis TaxID=7200 RepID=UPI002483A652|nr:uncharacterized protein LOC129791561 [Lutzomyia longipalpis]
MPPVEMTSKKNFKALKHAYFTHPSDVEKYYVIGGEEFRKLDVFDIEDGLDQICKEGFNKTTRLTSGDILVQTKNAEQIAKLKSITSFGNSKCPITVSENGVLNQSHAIIRCPEIMHLKIERIIEGLRKHYDVIGVQRLKRRVENKWIDTATHVITFNSPIIPAEIKVGFIHVKTELFIPAPFRCAICQKLGHTRKRCNSSKNKPTCSFCGQAAHLYGPCLPPRCVNCQGDHPSSSKICPRYLEEREINAIRVSLRIPYKMAKEEFVKRRGRAPALPISAPSTSRQNQQGQTSFADVVKSNTTTKSIKPDSKLLSRVSTRSKTITPKITQKEMKRTIQKVKEDERLSKIDIEKSAESQPNQTQKYLKIQTQNSTLSANQILNPLATFRGFHALAPDYPSCSREMMISPEPDDPDEPEPPDIEISSASDENM